MVFYEQYFFTLKEELRRQEKGTEKNNINTNSLNEFQAGLARLAIPSTPRVDPDGEGARGARGSQQSFLPGGPAPRSKPVALYTPFVW